MAEVRLTPQTVGIADVTPTFTSIDATDTYVVNNDARVWLYFKNTGASPSTVTIQTPRTIEGLAIAEKTLSVPATSGEKIIGNFNTDVFNEQASPDLKFTQDQATGVSVAVLRF